METKTVFHTLPPIFDERSKILILGTMPSPISRETGFYYNHPQNRFWKTIAAVLCEEPPRDNEEKRRFLLRRHIALWDVLASCKIQGASDSSIRDPVVNPVETLLKKSKIEALFATGQKAGALYQKYLADQTGMPCRVLPSTSPANARVSLRELIAAYSVIKSYL